MQQRMGGVLTYRHEDGMNYNDVLDDLIVGSCPQTAADVDRYTSPFWHTCGSEFFVQRSRSLMCFAG